MKPATILVILICSFFHGNFVSAQTKRIYIAPDDHTDYFWTAGEATYRQAFIDMLDFYLNLADTTAGEIPEHQSRWNTDGSFWIWTYEQNKTAVDFNRLIDRIRDGHISMPLNAWCSISVLLQRKPYCAACTTPAGWNVNTTCAFVLPS